MRPVMAVIAVALVPKCVLCLAAYFAVGVGAGAVGREFCGGGEDSGGLGFVAGDAWFYGWMAVLLAVLATGAIRRCGHVRRKAGDPG